MDSQQVSFNKHDIQLVSLAVHKLHIEQIADDSQATDEARKATGNDVTIFRRFVGGDAETGSFRVGLEVQIGWKTENPVYRIEAGVIGTMEIPKSQYVEDKVRDWSETNGYYLLLPFLRETIFTSTKFMPSGPYFVPLITLPQIDQPGATGNE